jgi:hypothetical protein
MTAIFNSALWLVGLCVDACHLFYPAHVKTLRPH